MDAGREPCWWHSDGPDEMSGRVGSPAGKQRVTAGFICPEKRYCGPGSLRQSSARTLGAQDLLAYVLLPWERTHLSCHWHR